MKKVNLIKEKSKLMWKKKSHIKKRMVPFYNLIENQRYIYIYIYIYI